MRSNLEDEIRKYCSNIGTDQLLVQGAGGNVSWKDGQVLWVKASGKWLSNAKREEIFVPVDLCQLNSSIRNRLFSITHSGVTEHSARPSIETILHALLPHKIVFHLHPVNAVATLVREDAEHIINQRVNTKLNWCFVDYFKPGAELAAAVREKLSSKMNANVVFMKNHGIVLGADSIQEIDYLLQSVESLLQIPKRTLSKVDLPSSRSKYFQPVKLEELHQLTIDTLLYSLVTDRWAICPDQVVFLGKSARCFLSWHELSELNITQNNVPDLIFINKVGVFTQGDMQKQKLLQLQFYYEVLIRQDNVEKVTVLKNIQIDELLNWEAENYRKQIKS